MLYSFLTSLIETYSFLNVFKYITFRIGLSVVTSLIIIFLIGSPLINYFERKQITGPIRQDGPIDHIIKKLNIKPLKNKDLRSPGHDRSKPQEIP